jgi:hypothetical protein
MRIIHQFARFLARVLFSIKSGNIEEARLDIQKASEQFLGLRFDMILSLSNQGLIDIFSIGGEKNVEKSYVAAQLLFCEAKVRDENGQTNAEEIYLRSLELLLRDYSQMDDLLKVEADSSIDQILLTLRNQHFPVEIYKLLLFYYEQRGDYSKAEDYLFELVEGGFNEAQQIGESFYERMLKMTDQELVHGNLPRSEVKEGMQELRAKFDT